MSSIDTSFKIRVPERIITPSGKIYDINDLHKNSGKSFNLEFELASYTMELILKDELTRARHESVSFENDNDMLSCALKYGKAS